MHVAPAAAALEFGKATKNNEDRPSQGREAGTDSTKVSEQEEQAKEDHQDREDLMVATTAMRGGVHVIHRTGIRLVIAPGPFESIATGG